MKMKFYCAECTAMQDTEIIEKEQTLSVNGCEITLTVPVRICSVCREEILDQELDAKTLNLFYDEYRKIKNLLSPKKIKEIRQKYNLSQASFSKLLGFGEKTITRYENGAIQDFCHDNLIRLMESIDSFSIIWNERKSILSRKEIEHIERILYTYKAINCQTVYSTYNSNYSTRFAKPLTSKNNGDLRYA